MQNVYNEDETYVCITHINICPCKEEGNHLISNWKVDVDKILKIMENNNGN